MLDAYMRPVLSLGHCHYKGGGGTSTTVQKVEIAEATEDEKALQKRLLAYSDKGLDGANKLQDEALNYINKTYNPDWKALIKKYNGNLDSALNDYKTTNIAFYSSGST